MILDRQGSVHDSNRGIKRCFAQTVQATGLAPFIFRGREKVFTKPNGQPLANTKPEVLVLLRYSNGAVAPGLQFSVGCWSPEFDCSALTIQAYHSVALSRSACTSSVIKASCTLVPPCSCAAAYHLPTCARSSIATWLTFAL